MKIELKKLKISEHLSEETTAFTAEIHVNGMNVGYARNTGQGGPTDYHHNPEPECRALMQRAEAFCLALPVKKYDMGGGRDPFVMKMNMEHFIDELVEDELKKKDQKKLEKKMINTVMWGVPNGHAYTQVKFKVPLAQIPTAQLQGYIEKYKKDFEKGEQFLNTNLDKLGIKI
jgi:hypothetical protein